MTVYETDEIIERVILVGVAFDTDDDTERSLDELGELAKTAGAQTVGRMIQTRDNFHPATYIGKGKIEETINIAGFTVSVTGLGLGRNGRKKKNKKDHKDQKDK